MLMNRVCCLNRCGIVDIPPFGKKPLCFVNYLAQLTTLVASCQTHYPEMSLQVLTTSSASQITALIDRNHRSVLPDKFHRRWYFNHLKQTKHFNALYQLLSALPLIHSNLLLCQDHHDGQCLGSQVKQLLRNLTTLYSHIGSWKARIEINLFNAITTASEPEVDKLLQSTINEVYFMFHLISFVLTLSFRHHLVVPLS